MKRLIVVEWETGPDSGTDEEACDHLEMAWHGVMEFLVDRGYVDPVITMEPSTVFEALQHYIDHPSFSLDAGRKARLALGEGLPTDQKPQ